MGIDIYPEDYEIKPDDDDLMATIKEAIADLKPMERKIWLSYVESNYSQCAREFKVSVPTSKRYIMAIKAKLLNKINDDTKPTDNNDND